jgi:hypothetical protein
MPRVRRSLPPVLSTPVDAQPVDPTAPSPAEIRAQARAILMEIAATQGRPMPALRPPSKAPPRGPRPGSRGSSRGR